MKVYIYNSSKEPVPAFMKQFLESLNLPYNIEPPEYGTRK